MRFRHRVQDLDYRHSISASTFIFSSILCDILTGKVVGGDNLQSGDLCNTPIVPVMEPRAIAILLSRKNAKIGLRMYTPVSFSIDHLAGPLQARLVPRNQWTPTQGEEKPYSDIFPTIQTNLCFQKNDRQSQSAHDVGQLWVSSGLSWQFLENSVSCCQIHVTVDHETNFTYDNNQGRKRSWKISARKWKKKMTNNGAKCLVFFVSSFPVVVTSLRPTLAYSLTQ